MLYTRLDELPDAYVKCPGCGGLLADSGGSSGSTSSHTASHRAQHLQPGPQAQPYGYEDEDEWSTLSPYSGQSRPGGHTPLAYDDEDEYDQTPGSFGADPYSAAAVQQSPPRVGKIALAVGGLLLVLLCAGLGLFVGRKFLPQPAAVNSPAATETVLASLRPAINTPILGLPTMQPGDIPPTPLVTQPTPAQAMQSQPTTQPVQQPSSNPQHPPSDSLPPLAAPAPQTQPQGGVLDAQMSSDLQGGSPVDNVRTYRPTDTFYLAVKSNFGPPNVTLISTVWYGPDGTQIYRMQKQYDRVGTYYGGFTVKKSSPWQPGDYRADIYTNGSATPAYTVTFSVAP
ncbi:MAG: hypothetical protein M3014_14305 [Chloroflexota bacterium]|nr:hypothetical protein [Chloroflexota bacterium]